MSYPNRNPHNNNFSASSTCSAQLRRKSLRRVHSIDKCPQPAMPRLFYSVSEPTAPVNATIGNNFPSDTSFISTTSSQETKTWVCGGCSYRNGDSIQIICALCGGNRLFNQKDSRCNTDSITLVSLTRESASLKSSKTSCSRTFVPTKAIPNCTFPQLSTNLRRREDKEEVAQPPAISHFSAYAECQSVKDDADSDDDSNDDSSIASQVTRPRGSSTSRGSLCVDEQEQEDSSVVAISAPHHRNRLFHCSDGERSVESSSEISHKRSMPHEDPVEQPRRRGRQRPPVPALEEASEDLSPISVTTKERKTKKKKSIRDFLGFRRRSRRPSGTESTEPPSDEFNVKKDSSYVIACGAY